MRAIKERFGIDLGYSESMNAGHSAISAPGPKARCRDVRSHTAVGEKQTSGGRLAATDSKSTHLGYAVLTGSLDCLRPHAMNRSILIANLWWLAD
ncbi:hypothetical protein DXU07_05915 [Bradyrhizobium elkanii]|nr:hypothetical protein [Bradyrhizobium elkanii]NWL70105.1 hypothetical protein [Bradyrhizobium elkanii]OIM93775.1 hypothetical protein BLN97_14465 [Bradyrhizobium elkanii]RYM24147.1 hypothetical protein EWH13_18760 [Bradyrhizobium elkanii]